MTIPLKFTSKVSIVPQATSMRKDFRLWVGVVLIISASLLGGKLFNQASHRVPAAVVISSLGKGSIIRSSDVQLINVAVPNDVQIVTTLEQVVGMTTTQDLSAGSLLNPSSLSTESDGSLRSISIPIKAGHLPAVMYGSLVDIWFTPGLDGAQVPGPSQLLAANVIVGSVPELQDSSLDTAITVRISEQSVAPVMQALRDGSIDIAIVDGMSND